MSSCDDLKALKLQGRAGQTTIDDGKQRRKTSDPKSFGINDKSALSVEMPQAGVHSSLFVLFPVYLVTAGLYSVEGTVRGLCNAFAIWRAVWHLAVCPGAKPAIGKVLIANAFFLCGLYGAWNIFFPAEAPDVVIADTGACIGGDTKVCVTSFLAAAKSSLDVWFAMLIGSRLDWHKFLPLALYVPMLFWGSIKGGSWSLDLAKCILIYREPNQELAMNGPSTGDLVYDILVWVLVLLQVKYLNQACEDLADWEPTGWWEGTGPRVRLLMWCVACALQCALYAMYSIKPVWDALRVSPRAIFIALERRWEFVLGYGLPYVVVMRNTSFFGGYAFFLVTIPFAIVMAASCDINYHYRGGGGTGCDRTWEHYKRPVEDDLHLILKSSSLPRDTDPYLDSVNPFLLQSLPFFRLARLLVVFFSGKLLTGDSGASAENTDPHKSQKEYSSPNYSVPLIVLLHSLPLYVMFGFKITVGLALIASVLLSLMGGIETVQSYYKVVSAVDEASTVPVSPRKRSTSWYTGNSAPSAVSSTDKKTK